MLCATGDDLQVDVGGRPEEEEDEADNLQLLFPSVGKSCLALIAGTNLTFASGEGGEINGEEIATGGRGGLVVLYLSATWCGASRRFSPRLLDFVQRHDGDLCCLLVSVDLDKAAAKALAEEHPTLPAFPYENASREKLIKQLRVRTFPSVVVLNAATGKVVTKRGRLAISTPEMMRGSVVAAWKAGHDPFLCIRIAILTFLVVTILATVLVWGLSTGSPLADVSVADPAAASSPVAP